MPGKEDQEIDEMFVPGLDQAEARELQANLNAEEWTALLAVQHAFANAPMLTPSSGFGDRVMQKLVSRELAQARRRSAAGILALALGSIVFTALLLSPLDALTQANGWAEIANALTSSVGILAAVLDIAGTFAQVLAAMFDEVTVVGFSLFALLLTILWTRVVVGWTPLNRPEPV